MMNKNTDGDSWGQLLSDFGIEDKKIIEHENPESAKPEDPAEQPESFGTGLTDSEESANMKEKKSVFSRFPKINFFGVPPEVSLDSVIEGVKSPSLGGKAFTDNKMEKMPLSREQTDREEKHQQKTDTPDDFNAWAAVASQIDTLASDRGPKTNLEERPSKRNVASMFDDPIPESDEARALKNLMAERPERGEKHRADFLEEESDSRHRGRRYSQPSQPESEEKEVRGRGSRYKPPVVVDDLPEEEFEPIRDDEPRGRGRRGSKYANSGDHRGQGRMKDNVQPPHEDEEWSEIDAALQQADRDKRAPRSGRQQRYDNRHYDNQHRGKQMEEPVLNRDVPDEDDSGVVMVPHGNIPSWDEAIGDIVSGNIARHKSGLPSRGRR